MTSTTSLVPNAEDSKAGFSDETELNRGAILAQPSAALESSPSSAQNSLSTASESKAGQYQNDTLQFEGPDLASSELLPLATELTQSEDASETVRKWAEVRAYGFAIAGFNLLAPIGVYCEVITQFHLAPLPNAPEHCAGLIPLRGNLVPVYQLHSLFGKPAIDARYAMVIGSISRSAALVVEDKPIPMDFEALVPVSFSKEDLPEIMRENISGCFQNPGDSDRPWYVLEHLPLFKSLARLT